MSAGLVPAMGRPARVFLRFFSRNSSGALGCKKRLWLNGGPFPVHVECLLWASDKIVGDFLTFLEPRRVLPDPVIVFVFCLSSVQNLP